jgi:hypothetical protein
MTVHSETSGIDREERIRLIAYSIWESEGRPEGKSEVHWLRACELVDSAEATAGETLEPKWLQRNEADAPEPEKEPEDQASPLTDVVKRLSGSKVT